MSKLWYAVQRSTDDDWGTGSLCLDDAIDMLMSDEDNKLIAVIDDGEDPICIEEIYKEDLIDD